MTPPPERQDVILQLLRQRDEEGMRELFHHYAGALLTVIQAIVPNQQAAEEVLQDVLLKIWHNIGQYDPEKSRFFTWMARIARNQAIDRTRSKGYRQDGKTDGLGGSVAKDKLLSTEPTMEHIGVRKLLNQLDDNHRSLIELLYLGGYTQQEAADKLNIPLGTVKTRSRRAILQLRKLLDNEMSWLLVFITLAQIFPQF